LAIGPNERAATRKGPLRRGRPATKSEDVVVFMPESCAPQADPDFPATRQWPLTENRDARAQAIPLRIAQAVASARPPASILR
jgi:hypothetical protein